MPNLWIHSMRVARLIRPVAAAMVLCGFALAASPRLTELAVDQVMLKSGARLVGSVLHKARDGTVTLAVRREWLSRRNAKFYEQQLEAERKQVEAALGTLDARISAWKAARPDDDRLGRFLSREAERLGRLRTEGQPPPGRFLLVDVPRASVDTVFVQPAARKQVALVAWQENLTDIEGRSAASLSAELKDRGINVVEQAVDLSGELPPRAEDERSWFVRKAIVEYHLRKSLAFQGTGDVLFRTDGEAPDLAKVMGEMLKSQLEAQLSDLLGEPATRPRADAREKSLRSAREAAEKEQASGFRVTRLSLQFAQKAGSVEGQFVARMPDGQWVTAWRHAVAIDAAAPREDVQKQLRENEQVRKVLDLAKAGGLGATEDQVQQALQFGAATMAAQEAVDASFSEFFQRYTARLDGPPLPPPLP